VIWWSVATVLTPIAAKIGLPFLLVMRAFMGIGEVGLFPCFSMSVSLTYVHHLDFKSCGQLSNFHSAL
jgi:hypothetical protein